MKKILGTLIIMSFLGAQNADATFVRFWRGHKKADMTAATFIEGINNTFIPATGALAQSPARLLSYQPVLTSSEVMSFFEVPEEFALVEYRSEDEYRSFRNTEAGIAYSDLHWDYFIKDKSVSAVPENYRGSVATETAYDMLGDTVDWNKIHSRFTLQLRDPSLPRASFLQAAQLHIEETARKGRTYGMRAYIVLVMPDYIASYEGWSNQAHAAAYWDFIDEYGEHQIHGQTGSEAMNIPLPISTQAIEWGEGLKYPTAR